MKQINKLRSALTGEPPIFLANDGKPVYQLVIRHKDIFFMIDIDSESGDPTGEFGWSKGTAMTHTPIREYHHTIATYPEEQPNE